MLIHSLEVHGIKKFASPYHFRFQPGLNIIYGPNESGKTTIQEIIFHLLYTNVNTSEAENQKSWFNKNLAQARLTYETQKKEIFRLTKDFINKKTILECYSAEGWTSFTDKREQANRILKEHWGLIDKKIFNNIFFIKQKHLVGLDKNESLKLKDFFSQAITGTDGYSPLEAEKSLREQLDKIVGKNRSSLKGLLKQAERKLSLLQNEQKRVEKCLQEEELNTVRLRELTKKRLKKAQQLNNLSIFLDQYKEQESLLRQLTELEKNLAPLSGTIKELEVWEEKIASLDQAIKTQGKSIGQINLVTLQNWQLSLNIEKKQRLQLEKELEGEKEKAAKIIDQLDRINQGVDDYIASFGQQSLEEIGKLDKLIGVESKEIKQIKAKEKILASKLQLQKIFSIVMLVASFCLFPWKWWIGGIVVFGGLFWNNLERKKEVRILVEEKEEVLQELNWRKNNILETFFCQKPEEIAQQVARSKRQEQEIGLKMKELEFQREKINRLEEQVNSSLERIKEIEVALDELYQKTGAKSLTQLIMVRKDYEKKLGEKRDWENKLWGKLGGESIEYWRSKYRRFLEEQDLLLGKIKSYQPVRQLSLEELARKITEKEKYQKELSQIVQEINFCQTQEMVWQKQEFPSLNQLTAEINYWRRELQQLEEKAEALETAIEVLGQAATKIENQFYPQLEKAVGEIFIAITNQHYDSIEVKDNLNPAIYVQELASTVDSTLLSLGTLEQLYFALRIALGKVISRGKNLPFFLDDVLVNFDGTRRMKAMQILAKLAKEQQIFLFTHDLQDVLPSYGNVIELLPFRLEKRLEVS